MLLDLKSFFCVFTVVMFVGEREFQKNYWIEHSADLTVEAMMLDSKAADLDKEERPEVNFCYIFVLAIVFVFRFLVMSKGSFCFRPRNVMITPFRSNCLRVSHVHTSSVRYFVIFSCQ